MVFTRVIHFKYQKGMVMMIPEIIPAKMFLVHFTGILEITAGIGLMIPALRENTAFLLLLFFIVLFLANINSSKNHIHLFKADFTGPEMAYLYKERLPMQIMPIAWIWFFGIYFGSYQRRNTFNFLLLLFQLRRPEYVSRFA